MLVESLKICTAGKKAMYDLVDNTPYRVRNIKESLSINEITTLSFELPIENFKWKHIRNEELILFNKEYYRIKNASFIHDEEGKLYVRVDCKHYSDNLANDLISVAETTPQNVVDLMKVALCYDENGNPTKGWSVGKVTVDRVAKRGLEAMEQSPFSILLTIAEKYDGILKFNSQTMTVDMLERQPTDHPKIDLRASKNLKSIEISYDTSEMYTRLYCYGSTDEEGNELHIMSVNPTGKAYIDNFEYFYKLGYEESFVKKHPELFVNTNIWRDDNYYDAQDLYDDGIKELAKIAQPVVDVKVTALDMKAIDDSGNITKINLGDCIRVVDEDLGVDTLCNVIKREIDYENPHLLTIEVTNSVVYHDTLSKLFTNVSTSSSIVTSGGNLVGGQALDSVSNYLNLNYLNSKEIEAKYATIYKLDTEYLNAEQIKAEYLDAEKIGATYATIGSLNALEAQINSLDVDVLNAKVAEIENLTADFADITKLIATDAEIENLKAEDITVVGKLDATLAEIDTVKATYVQVGSFEAYKATVENLYATNAEIDSLKAKYIDALAIETDTAKIQQLQAAIAKIETLEATMANVETLVSKTIITDDLNASQATIDALNTKLANIDRAIIDIAQIENLESANAEIENLNAQYINAVQVDVENLNAKSATIEQLNTYTLKSEFGDFQNLTAENFEATNASIGSLDANVANINSVLAGNIGTGLLQAIHLTADNVVIDDAVIKSANIESIDTDIVTVGNDNIILSGSTQQFKDDAGNVRVQIGRDAQGNFTFFVADENGATIVSANGITENAVPDGLIVDKMVADNACIQASKVNYLDKDGNKTLQTVIETEQGRIETLIKETTIENEDGTTTSLKDAYNHTVQTVEGNTTTIANVQTTVNGMDSRITTVEQTANGLKTSVTQANTNATNAMTLAEQNADKFSWLVKSGTDSTNFELTDRTATLVADNINLNGLVTFNGLDTNTQDKITNAETTINNWGTEGNIVESTTTINGGYIKANTIDIDQLNVENIFADGTSVMNIINSQEINADRITSGTIFAERLDLYGLSVTHQTTGQETLAISNDGEITLRGTIESYDYVEGEKGWSINSEGSAEFNDITVRGSVINRSAGITNQDEIELFFADAVVNTPISGYLESNSVICTGVSSIEITQGDIIEVRFNITGFNDNGEIAPFTFEFDSIISLSYDTALGVYRARYVCHTDMEIGSTFNVRTLVEIPDSIVIHSFNIVKIESAVVFWAGSSFEQRDSAPFRVNNDGSIVVTKGVFSGLATSEINIGNISIKDPSELGGNDAIITIKNGDNGTKTVQLRDTNLSSFGQNIEIGEYYYGASDDTETFNTNIYLGQDGGAWFSNSVSISENTALNTDTLMLNGQKFIADSNGFTMESPLNVYGSTSDEDNTVALNVYGNAIFDSLAQAESFKVIKTINFNNIIECKVSSNGLDFNFI